MKKYYVDTSVWLNLFKKETDELTGECYWIYAEKFLREVIMSNNQKIIYSEFVLRELELKLRKEEYSERKEFMKNEPNFIRVPVSLDMKNKARKLESYYEFNISFYDLIHIIVAKENNAVLITQDKELIKIAKENGVSAFKPKESL